MVGPAHAALTVRYPAATSGSMLERLATLDRPPTWSIAVVAGLVLGSVHGCYNDSPPPPAFRFSCQSSSDCNDGEVCKDELCQVPCTATDDCPGGEGYAACFNGVCSHLCDADGGNCPEPQTCLTLPAGGSDPTAGGGGSFTGGGGASTEDFGICGVLCAGNDDCPDDHTCIVGFCLPPADGGETGDGGDGGSSGTDGGTTG